MRINTISLLDLMTRHGMTQAGLADKSGVSRQTINSTLSKGSCSVQTIGKIADAMGVSLAELIKE